MSEIGFLPQQNPGDDTGKKENKNAKGLGYVKLHLSSVCMHWNTDTLLCQFIHRYFALLKTCGHTAKDTKNCL